MKLKILPELKRIFERRGLDYDKLSFSEKDAIIQLVTNAFEEGFDAGYCRAETEIRR